MNKDKKIPASNERKTVLKVYVTAEEAERIKKDAGYSSTSTYIRRSLLTVGNGRYSWEISLGDLRAMTAALHDYNVHMRGLIGALEHRQNLYTQDINHFAELAQSTNQLVMSAYKMLVADRKACRKQMEAYLKKKLDEQIIDDQKTELTSGRKGYRN